MSDNSLSFDELPGAVLSLTSLVKDLAKEVLELRQQIRILSGEPKIVRASCRERVEAIV